MTRKVMARCRRAARVHLKGTVQADRRSQIGGILGFVCLAPDTVS